MGEGPLPGDETRQRLLKAAMELFALYGFAETSVRELTKRAQCNVASVSYHFGSKEKLYEAVMRHVFRQLASRREESLQQLMVQNGGQPKLRDVLSTFAQAFLGPFLLEEDGNIKLRLLLREMMQPLLPPEVMQRELIAPAQEALAEALKAAVPELPPDRVPLVTYSFVAQLVQVIHLHLFAPAKAAALTSSGQGFLDHIVEFTEGGIRSLASASKGKGT
jgi:AcrR family transcriptional regulator